MLTSDGEDAEANIQTEEIAFIATDAEAETTCAICSAEFLDSEDLDLHVKQVHQSVSICQFCETTYKDLGSYAGHIRDVHLDELKCCHFCTKIFTDLNKVKKHEKKHSRQNKMFGCSQCRQIFRNCREVEVHERIKHANDVDGVFLKCMTHLTDLLKLKAATLLQTDERVLICHICQFKSLDLNAYLKHLSAEKCHAYTCNNCGDIFKTKKNLIHHIMKRKKKCLNVNDYANIMDTCPDCMITIPRLQMGEHLKVCKIYKCNICDIVFKTMDELSSHQSVIHPSTLELDIMKCKYCSREFVGKHVMDKHIERSHKPTFHQYKYQCKICDDIFKHPQNLFGHYFSTHKDFEPYTCRLCDKKFRIRKRFTIHIKMDHKSVGFVEFDDQYNVFFSDKKSEKPFIPKCVIPQLLSNDNENDTKHVAQSNLVETETENEAIKQVTPQIRKTKRKKSRKSEVVILTSSDEEETESLLVLKKRAERKKFNKHVSNLPKKTRGAMLKRQQFTCKVCKKYCYTYQNYHNHMKVHRKNEYVECIKCSKIFSNNKELNKHMTEDHKTSKLIETLKSVLERKQGETQTENNNTDGNYYTNCNTNDDTHVAVLTDSSKRFSKTIKKVKIDKAKIQATIKPSDGLSAKKYIENFMSDINDPKETKSDAVVMTRYNSPYYRPYLIKLHKFTPEPPPQKINLKMPERFTADEDKTVKVTMKLVKCAKTKMSVFEHLDKIEYCERENYDDGDNFQEDDNCEFKSDSIPEVAQEVLLEGSEDSMKQIHVPQKIVIPQLPKGYSSIHIATLQSQAPYYKIIKVKGGKDSPIVIDTSIKEPPQEISANTNDDEVIRLADGTKLVTANPLAHLLGDKPVEEVMMTKKKHYKPVITNYKGLLAEALQNLDKPRKALKRKAVKEDNIT